MAGEAASLAADRADTARRRELRDALWDVLVELYGAASSKAKTSRGAAVTELAELLTADHVEHTAAAWSAEVKRRHAALSAEWGLGKTTMHAFVKNFGLAGKLADGEGAAATNGNGRSNGMTAQDMFDDAMADQAAGL